MSEQSKLHLAAGIAGIALLCSVGASATIYKWVDSQGKVNYSDQPQSDNAVPVNIRISQPARQTALRKDNQSTATGKPADSTAPTPVPGASPQPTEVPVLTRKEKRLRCNDARQRLQALTARNRVRERDAQGNLRYLSEQERQQRLKTAQKNIHKYCR